MINFGQAYTEYASARTDSPIEFHRYAAVTVCAAALGNRVYIDAGWGRIYPSMWTCLVGRSGVRKSTAVNLAASLLIAADESLALPQDFTREAFYDQLASQPFGLLHWREMGSVLKALSRDYNAGTKETLTDLWDSPSIVKRRTKAGEVTITRPALSILAAGKPRWFVEAVRREDIEGGFISRWMFVSADQNNGRGTFFGNARSDAEQHQRDSLIDHLRRLTQHEGHVSPGEGAATLESWLRRFEGEWKDDERDPADFAQRAGTQVTKLAIGIQACRGISYLDALMPEAVEQAIQLFEYSLRCGVALVDQVIGHTKDAEQIDDVRKALRSAGKLSRMALVRKMRMKARLLDECIATLIEGDEVSAETEEPEEGGPGRRPVVYTWRG